jgi:hypothetical protein
MRWKTITNIQLKELGQWVGRLKDGGWIIRDIRDVIPREVFTIVASKYEPIMAP